VLLAILKWGRSKIDGIIDLAFEWRPIKIVRLILNLTYGMIYVAYHHLPFIGRMQYRLVDAICQREGWEDYRWMSWCTESRLCLILEYLYTRIRTPVFHHPLIFLPVLPSLLVWEIYFRIWEAWIIFCPARNGEAFLCPSEYPKATGCGMYPTPI